MKKIILLIVCYITALFPSVPVQAQSSLHSAYEQVLNSAANTYGTFQSNGYEFSTGIGYVNLVDFNNDGIDELLFCTGKSYGDSQEYKYHIYTYKNNQAVLIAEDSMEAHSGTINWEVYLWYSNNGSVRLSRSRYDDIACESEYLTFYEYDGNSWTEHKDAFASVAVETEPGLYYFEYYIYGEKVSETEYDSRLSALSRNGLVNINSLDFSESCIENAGFEINHSNYTYDDYVSAMYEAYDCGYIYVHGDGYYGKTYKDDIIKYDRFADEAIHGLWTQYSLDQSSGEYKWFENQYGQCLVYKRDVLSKALSYKFGVSLDDLLANGIPTLIFADNEYIVMGTYGRGEGTPGAFVIVDSLTDLGNNRVSCAWHMENEWFEYGASDTMYAILEKGQVDSKEIIAYKYLSVVPPSSSDINQSYWETGEYTQIATVGDYIYYAGPYYYEDGNVDGLYGLRMYNTKTREDIALMPRLCRADIIGSKIFAIGGGVSTGYWDRSLVVFDVGSSYGTSIASGIDMDFSMSNTPYSIYNNRIYIGHQTDMEHYEIISFNLAGEDIRVEVLPISTSVLHSETYENHAIIDGVTYYYIFGTNNVITVLLNNTEIEFDQPPIIFNDRTLVPLRAIFEALGATVSWDASTQTVTAIRSGVTIKITIGSNYMYKNGESIILDVPAMIVNDRTLVPVRAVSEALGCIVEWNGNTRQVIIRSNHKQEKLTDNLKIGDYIEFGTHPHFETPLKWIVVSVENDSVLLLADTTYCNLEYGCDYSTVNKFLDGIYNDSFSEAEKKHMINSSISDSSGNKFLFVFSKDEYNKYAAWTDYSYYVLRYKGKNTLYVNDFGISNSSTGNWLAVRPACYIDLSDIKSYSGSGKDISTAYRLSW